MKRIFTLTITSLGIFLAPLDGRDAEPAKAPGGDRDTATRSLSDRKARGSLSDRREMVRGDSGKWNDEPRLQLAPPVARKPEKLSLDDWADQLADEKIRPGAADDNWLIFRTRQLDDNDRIWVEKIERHGNEFTVVLKEAIWRGNYPKNFTWYGVLGVNLGKLAPGDYAVKWIVEPLEFTRYEDPPDRTKERSWPADERPAGGMPVKLSVAFTVAAEKP